MDSEDVSTAHLYLNIFTLNCWCVHLAIYLFNNDFESYRALYRFFVQGPGIRLEEQGQANESNSKAFERTKLRHCFSARGMLDSVSNGHCHKSPSFIMTTGQCLTLFHSLTNRSGWNRISTTLTQWWNQISNSPTFSRTLVSLAIQVRRCPLIWS